MADMKAIVPPTLTLEQQIASNPLMAELKYHFSKICFESIKFVPNPKEIPPEVKGQTVAYVGHVYNQYFICKRLAEHIFEYVEKVRVEAQGLELVANQDKETTGHLDTEVADLKKAHAEVE